MNRLDQGRMPFVEALEAYKQQDFQPFHTPGHKRGQGAPETLKRWMGDALPYDLGLMYAMDDYFDPTGVIAEAQTLASDLYKSEKTYFSINGTTGVIQMMLMGALWEGDKVLVPREAHKSVQSGIILSGATPVYMEGSYDSQWGMYRGATVTDIAAKLDEHPDVKALVVVYPDYYGVAQDISAIVELCHTRNVLVLVDSAHGPHFAFSRELPLCAIQGGADMVAQSTHKLCGSLTQTSMLHVQGDLVDYEHLHKVYHILMSTSPNYLFLASLDMARHQMATAGEALWAEAIRLSRKLQERLDSIDGIRCYDGKNLPLEYKKDPTKVIIDVSGLGLTGGEAEALLREQGIEVELIGVSHVLVFITIGDDETSIERLYEAVKGLVPHGQSNHKKASHEVVGLPTPRQRVTPRRAFYAEKERVPLAEAVGRICGEVIAYYPPGIPFIALGEEVTEAVVNYIKDHERLGYVPNGAVDPTLSTILVLKEDV